ncbi:PAS domain S-box protein [Ideonella sp. YS5]|uniref:PAS domain S-box protein n=1 Tax=Ideonella sp. YS5 TaxID=3453714 RepID=UPI003EED879F
MTGPSEASPSPPGPAPLRRLGLRLTLAALLAAALGLVVTVVLLVQQSSSIARDSSRRAALASQGRQLLTLLATLNEAESGQRGYLLTGRARYLQPYHEAIGQVPALMVALEDHSLAGPEFAARSQRLRQLIDSKLAELARTVQLAQEGRREASLSQVLGDAGQNDIEQIRPLLQEQERTLSRERLRLIDSAAAGLARLEALLVLMVTLLLVSGALAGVQLRRDIVEHRRLERRLAESERFVRQIADSVPVRIAYVDAERRFRFVNLAHCRRFGLAAGEILGHPLEDLAPQDVAAQIRPHAEAALRGEERRFEFEETIAGQRRRIENQLVPDRSPEGGVAGFYAIGVDITERVAQEQALRELNAIFESSPDFILQADHRGQLLYWNTAAREVLGMPPDELASSHRFDEFNTPETNRRFAEEITPAVKAGHVWVGEVEVVVAGGRRLMVNDMVIGHRDAHGRLARYSAVMRDITAVTQARQELALQAATLESIIEAMPAMVAVVDGQTVYRFANTAFLRWLGLRREDVVGQPVAAVLGAEETAQRLPWIQRALAGETVHFERSLPGRDSGRHLGISYIPRRSGERVEGFVVVAHDISAHKDEEARLARLAERDGLTGLLNRSGFERYLASHSTAGGAAGLAVLYIDLDHFKPVNDSFGHAVGDQVLRRFAERLHGLVRPTDGVARLGGDEFAVVLPGMRERVHAEKVADEVLAAAQAPFEVGDLTLRIGASVGVAFNGDHDTDWQRLVEHADARLYQAKAAGRGRRG